MSDYLTAAGLDLLDEHRTITIVAGPCRGLHVVELGGEPEPESIVSPLDRLRAAHANDPIALLRLDLYERAVEVGDHYTALQILSDHRMRMPRVSKASDADADG